MLEEGRFNRDLEGMRPLRPCQGAPEVRALLITSRRYLPFSSFSDTCTVELSRGWVTCDSVVSASVVESDCSSVPVQQQLRGSGLLKVKTAAFAVGLDVAPINVWQLRRSLARC